MLMLSASAAERVNKPMASKSAQKNSQKTASVRLTGEPTPNGSGNFESMLE